MVPVPVHAEGSAPKIGRYVEAKCEIEPGTPFDTEIVEASEILVHNGAPHILTLQLFCFPDSAGNLAPAFYDPKYLRANLHALEAADGGGVMFRDGQGQYETQRGVVAVGDDLGFLPSARELEELKAMASSSDFAKLPEGERKTIEIAIAGGTSLKQMRIDANAPVNAEFAKALAEATSKK